MNVISTTLGKLHSLRRPPDAASTVVELPRVPVYEERHIDALLDGLGGDRAKATGQCTSSPSGALGSRSSDSRSVSHIEPATPPHSLYSNAAGRKAFTPPREVVSHPPPMPSWGSYLDLRSQEMVSRVPVQTIPVSPTASLRRRSVVREKNHTELSKDLASRDCNIRTLTDAVQSLTVERSEIESARRTVEAEKTVLEVQHTEAQRRIHELCDRIVASKNEYRQQCDQWHTVHSELAHYYETELASYHKALVDAKLASAKQQQELAAEVAALRCEFERQRILASELERERDQDQAALKVSEDTIQKTRIAMKGLATELEYLRSRSVPRAEVPVTPVTTRKLSPPPPSIARQSTTGVTVTMKQIGQLGSRAGTPATNPPSPGVRSARAELIVPHTHVPKVHEPLQAKVSPPRPRQLLLHDDISPITITASAPRPRNVVSRLLVTDTANAELV